MSGRARLILSHRNPGRYAFNVLVGALETLPQDTVDLVVARNNGALRQATRDAVDAGVPTVVAWSFYSPSLPECAQELHALRVDVPGGWTSLAGGVHATGEPLETLQAGFDRVLLGEGEHAITQMARALSTGVAWDDVPGVARLLDGRASSLERAAPVERLDDWPAFGARHQLYGAIELTRGCIYACRFCQTPYVQKARFRHRSVDNVVHWATVMARDGLRDIRFISPTSLSYGTQSQEPDLDAVEELLRRLREALGPHRRIFFGTFPSEVRPEHVTPRAVALLRRYVDNDNLIIGGQSGSNGVLEASHRGHDVEAIERAVEVATAGGMKPNVDFILGLPGEDPADALATVALMERLHAKGARVHGHTFMPLPGTPFKNAPAGRVDAAARGRLNVLQSQGALYGQWKQQEGVAAALAARRR